MNKFKIINPNGFLKAMNDCNNGQFGELSSNDFEIEYDNISPLKGYEKPVNNKTGEVFPYCCIWHKSTYENSIKWFENFPNCCEWHKKLNAATWFNKDNYKDVANKVVTQLSYTEHCISESIETEDWYKSITDYIDINISSFGQLPHGFGSPVGIQNYIGSLKQYITHEGSKIPKEKATKLIEYIEAFSNGNKNQKSTDLNILIETYKKWLKVFPFEISFFGNLKEHFTKTLPIINGKPEVNKYTGIAKAKMHTKSSLIDVLQNITLNLLDKINVPELRKQGAINDIQTTQLEFSEATLKTKTAEITKQFSKGELKYIKALKKWLQIHKDYFKENEAIFKALPPQQINTGNDRIKYTAKHHVLVYLFECNAKGESFPIGNKTELEKIGNNRIGIGKGNRFYKVFNELIKKDLNVENNLIEIGGENWREAVKALTNTPELIEQYLQSKQL